MLVYNNKEFSDEDIESIQRVGASGKSDSAGKTGRFGLGFNACYNVTEVPAYFTRGKCYFFDPHRQTLPDLGQTAKPGKRYSIEKIDERGWPLLDAFSPFVSPAPENNFSGTVFRLPFRSQ